MDAIPTNTERNLSRRTPAQGI
ncbi:MAG: hypothetical protein AVDCRST_MAG11-1586, partial [uncultured Gemmatimonadaceae bacterium]